MAETKIAMKIDEETKALKELCDKLVKIATLEVEQNPNVDAKEMGEVVDMIKDLSEAKKDVVEACYKKGILEAMEEESEGEEPRYYRRPRDSRGRYMSRGYDEPMSRDYDEPTGRFYEASRNYGGGQPRYYMPMENDRRYDDGSNNGRMYYTDNSQPRDGREGRSGQARRGYMESKELHKNGTSDDKQKNMESLSRYMEELSNDITEMVGKMDASEKQMLKTKLSTLSQKIG